MHDLLMKTGSVVQPQPHFQPSTKGGSHQVVCRCLEGSLPNSISKVRYSTTVEMVKETYSNVQEPFGHIPNVGRGARLVQVPPGMTTTVILTHEVLLQGLVGDDLVGMVRATTSFQILRNVLEATSIFQATKIVHLVVFFLQSSTNQLGQ